MAGNWIGVDFDCTLCEYYGWGKKENGKPIYKMVEFVKSQLANKKKVKILTARVSTTNHSAEEVAEQRKYIEDWCLEHIGTKLEVTCEKDSRMVSLYDDRAFNVIPNTGVIKDDRNSIEMKKAIEYLCELQGVSLETMFADYTNIKELVVAISETRTREDVDPTA